MRQYIDTVQDLNGNAVYNASVLVTNLATSAAATIYSDNGVTTVANSTVTTDITGQYSFYVANGAYSLQISYNGAIQKTLNPVSISDPNTSTVYTDSGAVNALVITPYPAWNSVANIPGVFYFKAANTTTNGSATLNPSGLGAGNLNDTSGRALNQGTIISGYVYACYPVSGSYAVLDPSDVTGSFTGTMTGGTTAPTGTCNYRIVHNIVTLQFPSAFTATSNASTFTITGAPGIIAPATTQIMPFGVEDNGTWTTGSLTIPGVSGAPAFGKASNTAGAFTSSGTKACAAAVVTYTQYP